MKTNLKTKKISMILMSALIAFSGMGFMAFAADEVTATPHPDGAIVDPGFSVTPDAIEAPNAELDYIIKEGMIINVTEPKDGSFEILVGSEDLNDQIRFNISNDTVLVKKTKSLPIVGDKVLVAYRNDQPMALSYPPLTNAQVVIYNFTEIDGEQMMGLRDVSETLGYKVEWVGATKSILITKEGQAMNFTVRVGNDDFGYARAVYKMDTPPVLVNGTTYISTDVLKFLTDLK